MLPNLSGLVGKFEAAPKILIFKNFLVPYIFVTFFCLIGGVIYIPKNKNV